MPGVPGPIPGSLASLFGFRPAVLFPKILSVLELRTLPPGGPGESIRGNSPPGQHRTRRDMRRMKFVYRGAGPARTGNGSLPPAMVVLLAAAFAIVEFALPSSAPA